MACMRTGTVFMVPGIHAELSAVAAAVVQVVWCVCGQEMSCLCDARNALSSCVHEGLQLL